ncbi:NADP-dependent oxidoreductase domain-containing protein [Mycena maculata]|uniref:NADP-dependent oxidoreductase domain-containing protein n=1 Tax=Mycena maculata TaxID=230809 RepID=A0AAD7NYI1_9AGAR|nr:NADP-dependent oxidoreductase domain-containing protein [Mycena maculata]
MSSDEERFKKSSRILDHAYARGCTFWDTTDNYNDNEELIGKWLKRTGKRQDVFIATKFGYYLKDNRTINGDPEYVRQATENSLKKLGVSCIDLMYLHARAFIRADTTVPIEVTAGAMAKLVKLIFFLLRRTKSVYIGLPEVSARTIRRAHAVHPIAAVEVEYSSFNLEIEDPQIGVRDVCRELGITIVAYSPLGRGILTGQVKSAADFPQGDFRKMFPKYNDENFPNIFKLAEGGNAQGEDIPIPGTKKTKYLEENLQALKVKLTPADLELIRDYIEKSNATKGDRYPAWGMELAYADTPKLS